MQKIRGDIMMIRSFFIQGFSKFLFSSQRLNYYIIETFVTVNSLELSWFMYQ